jgi:hypothetical protein
MAELGKILVKVGCRMTRDVPQISDGICQFCLFVVAIACGALAAIVYLSEGPMVAVILLSTICGVCSWAATFAPSRVRRFVTDLFSTSV